MRERSRNPLHFNEIFESKRNKIRNAGGGGRKRNGAELEDFNGILNRSVCVCVLATTFYQQSEDILGREDLHLPILTLSCITFGHIWSESCVSDPCRARLTTSAKLII